MTGLKLGPNGRTDERGADGRGGTVCPPVPPLTLNHKMKQRRPATQMSVSGRRADTENIRSTSAVMERLTLFLRRKMKKANLLDMMQGGRGGLQNELSRQAGRTTQLVPGIGCTSLRRLETRAEEGRKEMDDGDDEDHDDEKLPLRNADRPQMVKE